MLADGRLLSASQALSLRLIDATGYLEDAIAAAEELAGITDAMVVRYRQPATLMDLLSVESHSGDPARELAKFLSGMGPAYLADEMAIPAYRAGIGAR